MNPKQRKLLESVRRSLLAVVDALEIYLDMPRTKDARKVAKDHKWPYEYKGVETTSFDVLGDLTDE